MRIALVILGWTVFAAAACAQAREHPRRLTVMTWNVEWFFDNESGDNYSDLAKEKTAPSRRQWDWKRDAVAQSIADSRPEQTSVYGVRVHGVLAGRHRQDGAQQATTIYCSADIASRLAPLLLNRSPLRPLSGPFSALAHAPA